MRRVLRTSIRTVLLCFINPRVRKIRNESSSCPGIFSRTLRFDYVDSSPGSWHRCPSLRFVFFEQAKRTQKDGIAMRLNWTEMNCSESRLPRRKRGKRVRGSGAWVGSSHRIFDPRQNAICFCFCSAAGRSCSCGVKEWAVGQRAALCWIVPTTDTIQAVWFPVWGGSEKVSRLDNSLHERIKNTIN